MELAGKVVLITGASRGLGVDIARAFGARGCRLALAARSEAELSEVRASLAKEGAEAAAFPADVSDRASVERLADAVRRDLGAVDVLVNNAGIEKVWDFEDLAYEDVAGIIGVNVVGLIWLTRQIVGDMIRRRSGHVVNVASTAGLNPVPHNSVYSASKHAVVGFSRSLRAELAEHGVGVSVVCPGFVDGGMFLQWGRKAPKSVGSVTPGKVAHAVVRAVEKNKAEIIVAPGLSKVSDVSVALSPDLSISVMRRMGVLDYLREQARINASREN